VHSFLIFCRSSLKMIQNKDKFQNAIWAAIIVNSLLILAW
jgi:hypothetical protein